MDGRSRNNFGRLRKIKVDLGARERPPGIKLRYGDDFS